MGFGQALQEMVMGKRMKRLDWPEGEYGSVDAEGFLKVYHENRLSTWMVHKEDIIANDWLELEKTN